MVRLASRRLGHPCPKGATGIMRVESKMFGFTLGLARDAHPEEEVWSGWVGCLGLGLGVLEWYWTGAA